MPAQLTGALHDLLTGAAFAPVNRGFLRITGADATRWLNGMVTNSIQALNPGEGSYSFLLNAQGRILGDCTIYREPASGSEPSFLLETDADQLQIIQDLLDRFIIMDDVELEPLAGQSTTLLLGEGAPQLLQTTLKAMPSPKLEGAPGPLQLVCLDTGWQITTPAPGPVPRFHIRTPSECLSLSGALHAQPDTLEMLRILEARPRYGIDIRNTDTAKDLPQETNQTHALHFSKGCYVGQEIVERIRSRGQVHRLLTPLALSGPPSSLPAALTANDKPAGEITSATRLETNDGDRWIGLGYVRREATAAGAALQYEGGQASARQAGSLE